VLELEVREGQQMGLDWRSFLDIFHGSFYLVIISGILNP